jgi:hypothetical protein
MHAVGGCLRMHVRVFSCENVITLVDGVCLFAQIFDCTFVCKRDGDHRDVCGVDVLFHHHHPWIFPSVTSDKSCAR